MLVGAGDAGVVVARELRARADLGLEPVGFVDDDRGKRGQELQGLRVLGGVQDLPALVPRHMIDLVIIAIASASPQQMRRIHDACGRCGVPTQIIPGLYELLDGRVEVSRLRNVQIEDSLGRAEVQLEDGEVAQLIRGRVVLVTGAGGSIGSEMCRQVIRYQPARLLLLDRAENPLFHIARELGGRSPPRPVPYTAIVADICDRTRMEAVFAEHRPSLVIHAAAHKHVPLMEDNPGEAVKNNVQGTRTVAETADRFGADCFVLISTDKAVNPTSIMGATKRIAEMLVQGLGERSRTKYLAVRFGNVLGSTGSVVPLFREQIEGGGPLTVTDPEMRRYFMTIPEASQLVLQAAAIGHSGEILVLDMGEPLRIVDLAREMIRLSGLEEGRDIEIVFTGLRPGEKLFEELSLAGENATRTRHPKIFVGKLAPVQLAEVAAGADHLLRLSDGPRAPIEEAIAGAVPEYRPGGAIKTP